jgi:transcription antitermination factor NusG
MGVTIDIGKDRDWRTERLWYAVQTRSKSEHVAAAGLVRFGEVEVYCPRVKFQRPTARGPVWFTEALFPGYIFARFEAGEYLRAVRHSNAVTKLLQFGEDFAVVPDEAVQQIRKEMGGEDFKVVEIGHQIGDEVEVASGPLRGMSGIVTNLLGGDQRVRLLLEFLGGVREFEVDAHRLRTNRGAQEAALPDEPDTKDT